MSLAPNIGRKKAAKPSAQEITYRVKYGLTAVLAGIAALAFIFYLSAALEWRSHPFFGALVSQTLVVTGATPQTGGTWPALQNGLQARDHIIELDGQPLGDDFAAALEKFEDIIISKQVGEMLTVTYERPSGERDTTTYPVGEIPGGDFLVYFVIPYVTGIIVFVAGMIVLVLRPKASGALVGAASAFLLSIFMAGFFDLATNHQYVPLWMMATALIGGVVSYMGMIFPSRMVFLYRTPMIRLVPLVVSALVGLYAVYNYYFPGSAWNYYNSNQAVVMCALMGTLIFGALLLVQRNQATSAITRDQSGTVLLGLFTAAAPGIIWLIGQVLHSINSSFVLPFNLEAATPFFVVPVISILYAFLQYHRFDTDEFFSRSLTYLVLLFALVIGYFLLTLGVSLAASELVANNPLMIALTLFIISVIFLPVRNHLQDRINAIYYRKRRSFTEKYEDFGQKLSTLNNYNDIITEFRNIAEATLAPTHVFVFIPRGQGEDFVAFGTPEPETSVQFAPNSGLATLLRKSDAPVYLKPGEPWPAELLVDRARLAILKPLLLVGLTGQNNQLTGIVVIGAPRSGRGVYGFEEVRFMGNIASQLSVAIERAQVIVSLESRVKELDVLSNVGQAVNFVIEFNDLLELINTQTSRLIDAEFFYIALYVEGAQEMYFAFFLEGDERYSENENRRWNVGNDLFSQVLRTNQPVREDDYSKLLKNGTYERVMESDRIKALMAVPLIAQSHTLGVLAVGKSKPGEVYTNEQLKIFGDIGALAATSIEKTRLFDEINVRARQLGTLNSISQELVAAEGGEIEQLLKIITNSAVEILNAEAGSLLLEAGDDSGDMVFRVVIGGKSNDLVGKRLERGHGLVGEVARSAKPQIVNDVRRDGRWEGEITKSGFRTDSILAVPLIAKERVIGVLEVLNKKDGTVFVMEDAELLVTLAGQAAIAIENARLFAETGSQLNQTLRELQTLERIDRELARTLNITRVSEITVKWAVANSGAVAAALGEVVDNQRMLKIHAIHGYRPEEYPEGSDGKLWPLDRGIVSRVMRTRQPELAVTEIDPDYEPTLTGSLSQITVPMVSGDDIIAILILETNHEPRFNLLDLEFVKRLTERASIALANAQLYEDIMNAAETKSEFIGFAAHELKNPLTSIKSYSAILASPGYSAGLDEEKKLEFLNVIRNNADRMQTIIDDLRDIAASDAGKLNIEQKPVKIHEVVEETLISFAQQIADKGQIVHNEVSPHLPEVLGDKKKLIQVLTNLVSNAYKYTPEEGEIWITADINRNYREPRSHTAIPVLHVKVRDTGIGMSDEDLKRLFHEDYFRSDNVKGSTSGTGLGMMITQRIIQGHGGRIWVESKLNQGSIFQFVIPIPPENLADHKRATQETEGTSEEDSSHKAPTLNGHKAHEQDEVAEEAARTQPSRPKTEFNPTEPHSEPASD